MTKHMYVRMENCYKEGQCLRWPAARVQSSTRPSRPGPQDKSRGRCMSKQCPLTVLLESPSIHVTQCYRCARKRTLVCKERAPPKA